jgi:hypothetical protein
MPVAMARRVACAATGVGHSVMFAVKFGAAAVQPSGNYDGLPRASRAVQRRLEGQKSDQ